MTALHGVHRIRWSCAAAALVFVIGLAACARGPLHDALHPRFLSGNDAADRIDVRIGGMIVAHHPSVTVGRAKCPYLINLSGNAVGHCTLPVTGGALRIDVERVPFQSAALDTRPIVGRNAWVTARDAVIVRDDAERQIADDLEDTYGVLFAVRCQGPAIHIVPQLSAIRCALIYAGRNRGFARVRIDGDTLSPQGPPGLPTLEKVFARYGTAQRRDGVILDGGTMERYVRAVAGDKMHAALARRGLIHAAHCPARIVLKERGHAECTVIIGTHAVRYGMTYGRAHGLDIGTNSMVEIVPDIRGLSERYYAHVLPLIDPAASRAGARVHSDCGRDVITVVEVEDGAGTIPCTLHINKETLPFQVEVDDDSGDITFEDARH